MSLRNVFALFMIVWLLPCGCAAEKRGGPRFKTTPLTGIVQIDGEPTAFVTVECHPQEGTSELKVPFTAATDEDGKFEFAMYEKGDGIPPGTYALTFVLKTLQTSLKDKFSGAYADPLKSEFKVTVVEGEPNDMGVIELSSKGPEKK